MELNKNKGKKMRRKSLSILTILLCILLSFGLFAANNWASEGEHVKAFAETENSSDNYQAILSIDDNSHTLWASESTPGTQYFILDLGATRSINSFGIWWQDDYYATSYEVWTGTDITDLSKFGATVTRAAGQTPPPYIYDFWENLNPVISARFIVLKLLEKNANVYAFHTIEASLLPTATPLP